MQGKIRKQASVVARRIGLHGPLRALYNTIVLSNATSTISLHSVACSFFTPTYTIKEHVESFAGECDILKAFLYDLRPDDVVWDVGASFGLYSVFAAATLKRQGAVVAFEPEVRMRNLLAKNLALNLSANTTVEPVALSDHEGEGLLFQAASANSSTSALVQRNDYRLKKRGTIVALRSGDALVAGGTVVGPTVIKVDVEGAEGQVLEGMKGILQNGNVRALYLEIHPHLLPLFGHSPEMFEKSIVAAGFRISERAPRGTEYHLICHR